MIEFLNNLQTVSGFALILGLMAFPFAIMGAIEFKKDFWITVTKYYIVAYLSLLVFYCIPINGHCVGVGCEHDKNRKESVFKFEDCLKICRDTSRAVIEFRPSIEVCECGF